jgi:hypothetical protein
MSPRGGVRHLGAAVPATIRLGSYTQRIVETRQASVPRPPERDATIPGHATLVWAVSYIAYECALESRLVRFSDLRAAGRADYRGSLSDRRCQRCTPRNENNPR